MARRTDFRKANTYKGQKIKGIADISYKIDGVRILYRDGKFVTRNNKVPPGLDKALTDEAKEHIKAFEDCEIFKGTFHKSNGPLQQHNPDVGCIGVEHVFPLHYGENHSFDHRLMLDRITNPTPEQIWPMMEEAVKLGYEGLVVRTDDRWYRVKPDSTADVIITGWFEQVDKNKNPKGQLGGFTTNYGKVTAFKEEKRVELWDNPQQYVGRMMEVQYKELYDTGNFRYCVTFLRFRDDKSEEAFDTKA